MPEDSSPTTTDARRRALVEALLAGRALDRSPVTPSSPRRPTGPLPLSYPQQGVWLLDQIRPGGAEYVVPFRWRLTGPLDPVALRDAWREIIRRHEVLRTRYQVMDGRPSQVVGPAEPVELPVVDLTGCVAAERRERLDALIRHEAGTPFDLGRDAPLRVRLVRLAEDEHVMVLVAHHIAFDGWSVGVLARELGALYPALVAGEPSPLAPLRLQYADFSVRQRERAAGLTGQLDHWRDRLAGLVPLELPTDRPRPPVQDPRGATLPFTVPADLGRTLASIGRQRRATPFMVLLAAFQILLTRYTGQTDVAVGTPVAGRTRPEVQDLIGYFVNTLVLRTDLSGEPSFVEVLARVREAVLDAQSHQDVPFERIVDALSPQRDLSRNPLFQTMFVMQNATGADFDGAGLRARQVPTLWHTAKFDLTVQMTEEADGSFSGVVEYATALFDDATVRRLAGHYRRLLSAVVTDPDAPVTRLPMLTDAETAQLAAWNDTAVDHPHDTLLHRLVEAQADATPDAVAVADDQHELTYAQLDARANQLAHRLIALGAGPERIVGVSARRRVALAVALVAVLKTGAAYLPLDPTHPVDRLRWMLADAGDPVTLVDAPDQHDWHPGPRVHLDDPTLADEPVGRPGAIVDDRGPAYLIYTSGSTGRPKGVLVDHRAIVNRLRWMQDTYRLDHTDRILQKTPHTFDVSVWEFFWPLTTGATLVMARPDGHRDPTYLAETINRRHVTTVHFVPSMLRAFTAHLATTRTALPHLRRIVCSGEALTDDLAASVHAHLDVELHNLYGPTEAAVDVTATRVHPRQSVTIGSPIANTGAHIHDPWGNPVPVGVPGELLLTGVQLARGYHRRPALTAARFTPTDDGQRAYRTGDQARWRPDGTIEYLGRLDHQVKIRGNRIELGEIETTLADHPNVRAAVVHPHGPGDDRRLAAYLVAADGHTVDADTLRAHLRARLPEYMVPTHWITLTELPLTSSGKIDRNALPPPHDPTARTADHTPPGTPTQHLVATAYAHALTDGRGADPADAGGHDRPVGIHDRFFDIGGDSIRAIRVVGHLRDQGLDLTVTDLFRYRTVAELAEAVDARQCGLPAEATRLVDRFALIGEEDRARLPDGVVDAYPLSMVQAGMAYETLADPTGDLYLNSLCYPVEGDAFSLPALHAAAQLLAARHEILRASIDLTGYREPLQLIHQTAEIRVGHTDLRGVPAAEQETTVARLVAEERRDRFDLGTPSLLRLHAYRLADDRWRLLVSYSHAILDGWSQNSLVPELLAYYRRIRDGRDPRPAGVPAVRFADAVALERRAVAAGVDRKFWASRVRTHERLGIPAAWAGGGARYRAVRLPFADLVPGLRELARTADVPLKSLLFTAHLTVLGTVTGQRRFHSGLVCNGRPELTDGDQVRGMFLNTVPFAVELTGSSWAAQARLVFAGEVALWPHRHYPLPAMQREWGDQRPLVDVFFNYTDMHVLDLDGIDRSAITDTTPNEFGLSVSSEPGQLIIEAGTDRISDSHLDLLTRTYRRVLEAMVADPAGDPRRVGLPEADRRVLLGLGAGAALPVPDGTLPELVARQVAATPGADAVVFGDDVLSYAELERRTNRLAHHLRELGVGPGTLVGVHLNRSADLVVAFLAVLAAGGAYLPLDPEHPAQRTAFMLADAGAQVLVTETALAGRLDAAGIRTVLLDAERAAIAARREQRLADRPSTDDLAYVIYTSGSTGTPKGVMISHRGLGNFLAAMRQRPGLPAAATVVGLTTVSFDPSVLELYLPLLVGGRVVVADAEQTRDPQRMAELIRTAGPAVLQATPVTYRMLLDSGWSAPPGATVLCGGERLPTDLAVRLASTGATVWDVYGPTETTVWSTATRLAPDGRPVDFGMAPNAGLHVLDERLEPVPVGVPGEIHIGGDGVAWGYRARPALTAEKFVPDPHAGVPGARMYRTGDLARWHTDGHLEILGRVDHQVKIRGHRIEPAEIEAALLAHDDVRAAVVHPQRYGGEQELVAYLVGGGRHPVPAGERLREFLLRTLPDYMCPAAYLTLDALPLTPTGKVDRNALPVPQPGATGRREPVRVAPRTGDERTVAQVWGEVLGTDEVGVHDDFFQLGGHSLLATRVAVRLRTLLCVDVPVRALFDHPTVARLVGALPGYPKREDRPEVPRLSARNRLADVAARRGAR
ncbi:amino acid adenylation domain-containing protein [Micromonospora sp. C31]|uniref:non-ribosomal peptide synthetase n=1 Tax=Micromonospora sp. C31 TaxID=2824876 RepID=UPI001B38278A|nr:non-ribosomal peptide synthetase [Micromonospora sp. C31]MBQ1075162.1 amino acid adenylation domain-containing protein [Micromonospora sp. C31]